MQHLPPPSSERGFSLVELSIVLVILGLLTGGILAGKSLIRAAELRSVSTDIQRYLTATHAFRDKYFAIAGDMNNATRFWNRLVNDAACVTNSSASVATPGACDGSGNGLMDGANTDTKSSEYYQFWRQLALAGLVEGSFSGVAGTGADQSSPGVNVPPSKISNAGFSIANWDNASGTTDLYNYATNYGFHFIFGKANSSAGMSAPVLKPEEMWNLDTKMDDGKPGAGKFIAIYWDTCTTSTGATDFSGAYDLSVSSISCALRYKMP